MTSKETIKTILGITTSTEDARITALIREFSLLFSDVCNNDFNNDIKSKVSGTFNQSENTLSISASVEDLEDVIFAGGDFRVKYSKFNDNVYSISTIESDVVTISSSYPFTANETGVDFLIMPFIFPASLNTALAKMVSIRLAGDNEISSEKIGDYQRNFSVNVSSNFGLPTDVMNALLPFRNLKCL